VIFKLVATQMNPDSSINPYQRLKPERTKAFVRKRERKLKWKTKQGKNDGVNKSGQRLWAKLRHNIRTLKWRRCAKGSIDIVPSQPLSSDNKVRNNVTNRILWSDVPTNSRKTCQTALWRMANWLVALCLVTHWSVGKFHNTKWHILDTHSPKWQFW
jgi:hypothetical protein